MSDASNSVRRSVLSSRTRPTSYSFFRHFVADSLTALGRLTESRSEFETLIRDYPEDPWAYKKLADSYWLDESDEPSVRELERAAELYQQALDAENPLEKTSTVSNRLDEIEHQLADMDTSGT